MAVGVSLLPGAEVERGREKRPLCCSDMKATGRDRMSRQTAGRTSRNLSLSHTMTHTHYTDQTGQMSMPLSYKGPFCIKGLKVVTYGFINGLWISYQPSCC